MGGSTFTMPLRTRGTGADGFEQVNDVFRANNRSRFDQAVDFYGPPVAATRSAGAAAIPTTGGSIYLIAPATGVLTAASLVTEDALAKDAEKYLTFTLTNRGPGAGTTAMLKDHAANSTTTGTGGRALVAKTPLALVLSDTAANLNVRAGDVLEFNAAANATLDAAVALPTVTVTIATVPASLAPRSERTAGTPLISVSGGALVAQHTATSEVQTAGVDWADNVLIPATANWKYEAVAKISAVAANTVYVFGMASAFNATLDDVTTSAWFRVDGNDLSLFAEADDGTVDTNDLDTGIDLVADTYVYLAIECRNGVVAFTVNNLEVARIPAAAFTAAMLLQPVAYVQKAANNGVKALSLKWWRIQADW